MNRAVVTRAALYITLAGLGPPTAFFSAAAKEIADGKMPQFHWVSWVLLALNTLAAMLLVWRTYIDGSAERSRQSPPAVKPSGNGQEPPL